jgi:ATP-dependent RNA helicase DDX27
MPNSYDFYVHRVGRTARAGKVGRSISLVGEEERKLFKEIFKKNKSGALKIRTIAPGKFHFSSFIFNRFILEVVSAYKERINSLSGSIARIENKEREEKGVRQAESVVQKLKKSNSYTSELTDINRSSLKKFRYG